MTQDFKDLTLKYITNNITPEADNTNSFRDNETVQNNLTQVLADKGITLGQTRTLMTTTTSNYLIYGNYTNGSNQKCGVIIVFDENANILEVITQFDSGTTLYGFETLEYDENGNIYGTDYNFDTQNHRIILLNNVALETPNGYICKLRASYNIPYSYSTPDDYTSGTSFIKKVPGEATYFIYCMNSGQNKTYLIEFVNNVGIPNEWYDYNGHSINSVVFCSDFIIEVGNNSINLYMYFAEQGTKTLTYETFDGNSITRVGQYTATQGSFFIDLRATTKSNVYVTTRSNNFDSTYTTYILQFQSNAYTLVTQDIIPASIPTVYLSYQNGILFAKSEGIGNSQVVVQCFAYDGVNVVKSPTYTSSASSIVFTGCSVQNIYALYRFVVQCGLECFHPSIVIYNNYSGSAKEDYNSVSAAKGELYSNGYIVFARGLYNKQTINNRTIATLEIPNSYLNNRTIDDKNLLSYSNNVLATDSNQLTKNIYEQLFINFTNTLSVIDEDTSALYPNTASYINTNINVGTQSNCEDTFVGKIRQNYSDNTSSIQSITWTYNVDHYETSAMINTVSNVPLTIDFLSNDETTIYITKEVDLESNKYYLIQESLRME